MLNVVMLSVVMLYVVVLSVVAPKIDQKSMHQNLISPKVNGYNNVALV